MSWNKRYLEALCSVQKQKHKYQAIDSLQLGRALRGVCGGLFFSFFIPTGITSLVKYEFVTWLLFTLVAWWRGTYQPDITSTGSVIWVRISLQWVKLATTLGFYRLICFPLVRLVLWYGCLVCLVWSSFADPYHGLMVDRLVVSHTFCLVPCAVYILWNLQYLACLFVVGWFKGDLLSVFEAVIWARDIYFQQGDINLYVTISNIQCPAYFQSRRSQI